MEWPPFGEFWVQLGPAGLLVWVVVAIFGFLKAGASYFVGLFDQILPAAPEMVQNVCGQFSVAAEFLGMGPLSWFPWSVLAIAIGVYVAIVLAGVVAKLAIRALSLYMGGGGAG